MCSVRKVYLLKDAKLVLHEDHDPAGVKIHTKGKLVT